MLDPSLILCENCGYDVGSLEARLAAEPHLKCPECAKPIAESLPERRIGSPWQRAPGVRSLIATDLLALRRPRRIWRVVAVDSPSSRNLLEWNLAVTAVAWGVALAPGSFDPNPGDGLVDAVIAFVALNLLVLIEWGGVQVFARPRGWRTTGHVAWAIVAHASIGWLLGPLLAIVAAGAAMLFDYRGWGVWVVGPEHGGRSYAVLMLAVGIPSGLLAFETLVYLGFRAMRFANAPR